PRRERRRAIAVRRRTPGPFIQRPARAAPGTHVPRWIPGDPAEEAALLAELGFREFDELFSDVPRKVRLGRLGIGAGKDEPEVVAAFDKILARTRPPQPVRLVPRRADRVALPPRRRRRDPLAERVLHLLHAVPAGSEPGDAPGSVRVPEPLGRALGA